MEYAVFQKFLPFLIFAVSIVLAVISVKALFIVIPAFVASLYLGYPHSVLLSIVQISLLLTWVLLILGYGRGAAHSIPLIDELPKFAIILLIVIGLFGAGIVFVLSYANQSFDNLREFVLASLCGGIAAGLIGYFIVFYVACPLIVLKKEHVQTVLTDYYRSYSKRTRGNCYVSFKDVPQYTHYRVSMFAFRKFRNKVGASVSYIKYKCPFNVYFIRKIVIADLAGNLSQWDTCAYTQTQRKIFFYALVFAVLSVALLIIGSSGKCVPDVT